MAMMATAFIVPQEGQSLADQAAAALGGAPDIVVECAGFPGSLNAAVAAVKRLGTIMAPGFCWTPDSSSGMAAMMKEATIRYTHIYDRREFEIATEAMGAGHVEPRAMITKVVGLKDVPASFEELRGPNSQSKVMIRPARAKWLWRKRPAWCRAKQSANPRTYGRYSSCWRL